MPTTEALLAAIDTAFPLVPKPDQARLTFHSDGCAHCGMVNLYLEEYAGPVLPPKAIRYLCDEMSCLSAVAWRWLLPTYLRQCVAQPSEDLARETEFLIYNLSPDAEDQPDTRARLSDLSPVQLQCLLAFLQWCKEQPRWSEYCPNEISSGQAFLTSMLAQDGAA